MVISVQAYKIAYMALPKAACSSVKAMLAQIDPEVTVPPEDEINTNTWHSIYPTRRFSPKRWGKFNDFWRFCVVRDPAQRLMSCYTNRVVQLRALHNSRKMQSGRFDLPKDPDPDFFFQNLGTYRRASSVINHHALGSFHFLGYAPLDFDKVYKMENLADLTADLSDRTDQVIEVKHENRSTSKLDVADLQPETKDALRPFFDQEYTNLSGYYENPIA